MNLTELESIKTIAEAGSFANAAERLYTSRASLSALVARVEKELDASLFKRTTSGVVLTDAGKEYLRCAEVIMKTYSEMRHNISLGGKQAQGVVALGSSSLLFRFFLQPLIKECRQRYPNIWVNAEDNNGPLNEERLQRGALDLVITHLPVETTGLAAEPICSEPMILAVPQGHPIQHLSYVDPASGKKYIDIHCLNDQTMVLPYGYFRNRRIIDGALDQNSVRLRDCYVFRRFSTNLAFAAANGFLTMGPYSQLKTLCGYHGFSCYYIPGYEESYDLAVLYSERAPLLHSANLFKDLARDVIPGLYTDISNPYL